MAVGQTGVEKGFIFGETPLLDLAGPFYPVLDRSGRFARLPRRQVAIADRGDLDMDVDSIEKRSRDLTLVLADLLGRASAGVVSFAVIAAGTFLRCLSAILV